MFKVGDKVNIKPEAWEKFCQENKLDANKPIPPTQIITDMPNHPPYDNKIMLSFPFWWWEENDLIPVTDENIAE